MKKGYDVRGSYKLRVRVVSQGRVTRWTGSGKDVFVPNAAGRNRHCAGGTYVYAYTAVAR